MPIAIQCTNPDCKKSLRLKDEYAGKRVKCPGCGGRIVVPSPEPVLSLDDDPVEKPVQAKKPSSKQDNRAQGNAKQSPASVKAKPKRTIIVIEQPAPWNPTKIFLVLLIGVFLFPPFHNRSYAYKTQRNPVNYVLDRHTSAIMEPPRRESTYTAVPEDFERTIYLADDESGLRYRWTVYWGRLFVEMSAVALLAVMFTGRRRKWFAMGAGVLLLCGGVSVLFQDSPPSKPPYLMEIGKSGRTDGIVVRAGDDSRPKYEPPVVKSLIMDSELEGKWVRVSVQRDKGAKGAHTDSSKYVMSIKDRDISVELEVEGKALKAEYLLDVDPTKTPKTFMQRLTFNRDGTPLIVDQNKNSKSDQQIRALAQFRIAKGIYLVDGNKLRMCFQTDEQHPEEFTVDPDGFKGRVVFEFERFVPSSAEKLPKVEEPKKMEIEPKPLPADIVEAWSKAGGVAYWTDIEGRDERFGSTPGKPGEIFIFRFNRWKAGMMKGLPEPRQPFGLAFGIDQIDDVGLRDLTGFKSLIWLSLYSKEVTDVGLKELAALKQLQGFAIYSPNVTDAGMRELAVLKELRSLRVQASPITDAGLKVLPNLKKLRYLHLQLAEKVTDVGLKELSILPELRSLSAIGVPITGTGLKDLARLRIESINLDGSQISTAGLKEIAALRHVRELSLEGTPVTDAGLKELAGMQQLRSLNLRGTRITDVGLKELAQLSQLERLNLYTTNITDAGLQQLSGLPRLKIHHPVNGAEVTVAAKPSPQPLPAEVRAAWEKAGAKIGWMGEFEGYDQLFRDGIDPKKGARVPAFLFLDRLPDKPFDQLPAPAQGFGVYFAARLITDTRLKELAGFKNLLWLALPHNSVTDAGLKELAGLTNLQTRDLDGTNITDAGLKELSGLKQLEKLRLRSLPITDAGMRELRTMSNLESLELDSTKIGNTGLLELAHLKKVTHLSLNGTAITDGIAELGVWPGLQKLLLRNTIVTSASMKVISQGKQLQALDLANTSVKDADLKELAELSRLRSLNLGNTQITNIGLKELAGLNQLQVLNLINCKITDAGLKELAGLLQLKTLGLGNTQVTNAGMKDLAGLAQLERLDLYNTPVTEEGLKELAGLTQLQYHPLRGTKLAQVGVINPGSTTNPIPNGGGWQKDPTTFAGLFFGANLKKRTPDEARDLKYPKDIEKKVAGASIEWIGKVMPGPVSGGKNGNALVVSAGQDGTILIRGSSGYKDGDRFVTIEEQIQSLPILTRVRITMKIKTPVNAVIAFDGAPMLVLDGDDARVAIVK